MPTARQARAAANRREHHQRRLQLAGTDRERLRAACDWLAADAARAGRLGEATRGVLALINTLRHPPADHTP